MKWPNDTTQWSQTYYRGLTQDQHFANNEWLMNMGKVAHIVSVPNLLKHFTVDTQTETYIEVNKETA
tara:strand:+ start:1469 stop:1669 length:201 start_codon:yes stop_codon:yes gene_type:complete